MARSACSARWFGTDRDALNAADAEQSGEKHSPVQVWVNGFPQVAVGFDRTDRPLERTFRASLLLSKNRNEIEVKLLGAPLEIFGDPALLVDCQKPERDFQLHLWVLGVGTMNKAGLRERALAAFKGGDFDESTNQFKTPAFPIGMLYGPDCGELSDRRIYLTVREINRALTIGNKPLNDVVMIYYQGGEVVLGEKSYLRLRPGSGTSEADIFPLAELRELLTNARGAKLFLLDVSHDPVKESLSLVRSLEWIEERSPFGVLRFSFRRESPTGVSGINLADALRDAMGSQVVTLGQASDAVDKQLRSIQQRFPNLPLQYQSKLNSFAESAGRRRP